VRGEIEMRGWMGAVFGLMAGLLTAILGAVLLSWAVLEMPSDDLRALVVFLAASGIGSILLGVGTVGLAPRLGLGGVRARLLVAHLVVLAIAFANIVVTALLMFISPHDLYLLGLLLGFSAIVAFAFVGLTAEQMLRAIREISGAARKVAGGELGIRVSDAGPTELASPARLEQADRSRREAEDARRHLFAAISHDLRTPLSSIRAMIEALDDGVVTDAETTQRYIRTILGETKRLSGLIDDLFELSRLDAGALTLQVEPGSLVDLVSDTLEALQPQAAQKGLCLRGQVDEGLAPVLMDAARVQRVLYNLVQNAIRHTPADGTILLDAQDEANAVRVDVVDTGEGIAPEDLPRIFDRFYRGEKSRVRGQGGAGLGLAIAKGLVEAQGGRIWAQSTPGQGARFSFVLPKAPAAMAR
jgi:signal transduction histidine kinase